MTSRLRGPSRDSPKVSALSKPPADETEERYKPQRNGSRGNRYHFGMTRQEEEEHQQHQTSKNGSRLDREYKPEDPDLLYKRSREHFGAWDMRDIINDDSRRKEEEDRLFDEPRQLNGKSKQDRSRTESIERDQIEKVSRNCRLGPEQVEKDRSKDHERDLVRETEGLSLDRKSPDRRIRAMIERFKTREEDKMRSRRATSPDEGRRSRNRSRENTERHEDGPRERAERRCRSSEKFGETMFLDKDEEARRSESFRQRNEPRNAGKVHRRRSREITEDEQRTRDGSKRRSYVYDGPEEFDVRIQRYERAPPEPRKDTETRQDLARKESFKDLARKDSFKDLARKESFKDQDRSTKKSSFRLNIEPKKSYSARDSSLSRKTSFRDTENDHRNNNSVKGQPENGPRYLVKDPENELSRKNSLREHQVELGRKHSFKEQGDYGRIAFRKRENEPERKNNSFRSHPVVGVSRITFKGAEGDSGKVPYREHSNGIGRKNSFKEKTVEFGGITFKEDEDDGYKEEERVSFRDHDSEDRKYSPNGRYVEFGRVSFVDQDEPSNDLGRRSTKDRDSSRRRVSTRSKGREDRRVDRHSRPLTPPSQAVQDYQEEPGSRSWHESNKLFALKYLRENSKARPETETELSLELQDPQDARSLETPHDEDERRQTHRSKLEPTYFGSSSNPLGQDRQRNGPTIIRIRSSPDEPRELERRRRTRRPQEPGRRRRADQEELESEDEEEQRVELALQEEEEEEDQRRVQRSRRDTGGRIGDTPSRRVWNYREGGVLITDVEEGQPCLQCGETCPGFSPHTWRKNCTSCKCPREAHDVCHEEWVSVRSRLGLKGDDSSQPAVFDPRAKGLAWAPPGLPAHKVEEYFSMLPEISVPRLGTPGERHRDRQLAYQLPKQDLARAYCRHLNPKHASSADDFMAARNEIALDIGTVQEVLERDLDCGVCNTPLECGSLAVSASKLGLLYHPACFRCTECKELLVDLAYCVHDDTLYCERHYAEQLKPRCAACDELIFSGEYTKAMNKDWHSGHFCCWQCDESLTGQRYVLRDEHPYCIKCYESVFANGCEECNKIIGIDSKDLSYKDKHWHEACFLCNRCRVSLVDKQFGSKVDKIYCGNCYDAQFASRCDGCGEIFRAGTKKMEYKTRQWHEKCFCCVVCKNPIGTKSFIPREQEIYCAGCYEDKFATRCVKCNKIITSGGVTYKNEPWHRDCFTCSNCNNSLAGQRFTSRDDKPYCADCFGELFAKRCTACSKPITGIGGTRFISFEDRHWHNDCFICAGCKTSLVGRGFITDEEDVICPECAKMKLT